MLPTRRADLITRVIDGEVVILDRASGRVHQLNATASCIWDCCDGLNSATDISVHVGASFNVLPEAILKDVVAILSELEQLGLLLASQDKTSDRRQLRGDNDERFRDVSK